MGLKRKLVMFATAAVIAPLGLVVLPAATANAHGYISTPPSRQAQCARGTVSCGDIKWEPQSVEGPKGLRNCHGNVGRFADLNDDSKPWQATSVGRTVNFTWTFTARHATSTFEYFIGNTRVAEFKLNNQQPPPTLTHSVNLGNVSGRVKLLAVWNIGDTANAFYTCVDLQVGGSSPAAAPQPAPQQAAPASGTWASGAGYTAGSVVTYNGKTYRSLRNHTALPGWEPPSTPALWQAV
ncbi:lytic polysaccharide monooxygenase [Actinophytocola oryzae]|uniref:Chitin-binding protein n=1 Tax=Actinophytocola oryzae TaxID=502181 RepID=A0A4R7VUQ1_9PSEU|nr:lytic polysaccharide monooxygenase [Actinophytocola oryzae]TDV53562.1 chitin-binding protein [Actinophytocola oryzae]